MTPTIAFLRFLATMTVLVVAVLISGIVTGDSALTFVLAAFLPIVWIGGMVNSLRKV